VPGVIECSSNRAFPPVFRKQLRDYAPDWCFGIVDNQPFVGDGAGVTSRLDINT